MAADLAQLMQRFPLADGSAEGYWLDRSVRDNDRPALSDLMEVMELIEQTEQPDDDGLAWVIAQCQAAAIAIHVMSSHMNIPQSLAEADFFAAYATWCKITKSQMDDMLHQLHCP